MASGYQGIQANCFFINSVQPLSVERKGRPRAVLSQAVIACTVGLMANASQITGIDSDADALITVSGIVKNHFPEFNIKVRDSI